MPDHVWQKVSDDLSLFTCGYSFGPGHGYALAAPYDGGLAIISPPCNSPEGSFAQIEKIGPVRAIVAPNAFHNLGLASWKERFPDAALFAPAQSIPRVEKKSGVAGVKPLADAKKGDLELVDMPHYKTGEVLVRFNEKKEHVWYLTDVVMNMAELPNSFPFKYIFKWTGSAPGLRPNGIASRFMMKDRHAVYRWMRSEVEKKSPTVLIPCHGRAVEENAGERLLEILPS
jgi:hypothetical protein